MLAEMGQTLVSYQQASSLSTPGPLSLWDKIQGTDPWLGARGCGFEYLLCHPLVVQSCPSLSLGFPICTRDGQGCPGSTSRTCSGRQLCRVGVLGKGGGRVLGRGPGRDVMTQLAEGGQLQAWECVGARGIWSQKLSPPASSQESTTVMAAQAGCGQNVAHVASPQVG